GGRVSITPSLAETRIREFWANSGDPTASKGAQVAFRDAARALRDQLVASVEGAGFKNYGQLRRDWGSLQEIEGDVTGATIAGLRQKGGIGLTEGIAAGTAAAGHPGAGMVVEGTKLLHRLFGGPDAAVRRLFEIAAGQPGRVQRGAEMAGATAAGAAAGGTM